MSAVAIANNALTNVLTAVWLYALSFDRRFSRGVTLAICIGVGVAMEALALATFYLVPDPSASGMLVDYLLNITLMTCVYVFALQRGSRLRSCFVIVCYLCMWVLIYLVVLLSTGASFGDEKLVALVLRVVLNALALALALRFGVPFIRQLDKAPRGIYGTFIGIMASALVLLTMLLYFCVFTDMTQTVLAAGLAVMLPLTCLTMVLFGQFVKHIVREADLAQVELQNRLLREAVRDHERAAAHARRVQHDFRHHNLVVLEYARRGDMQAIMRYLEAYDRTEAEHERHLERYSSNPAVDGVVAAFARRAEEDGVAFAAKVSAEFGGAFSDADLVALIANMLENAVSACRRVGDGRARRIGFSISRKGRKYVVSCENSCAADVRVVNGVPERAGVGVSSIMHVVAQYGGDVAFAVSDGIFTCTALLDSV